MNRASLHLLSLLICTTFAITQGPLEAQNKLSKAQWLEDLEYVEDKLKNQHLKPYASVPKQRVDSLISDIRQNIPAYEDSKIVAEFSKLAALFSWGHTRMNLPVNYDHLGIYFGHKPDQKIMDAVLPFSTLPLRIVRFEEGHHVQSTTEEYAHLLGKKITHIGSVRVEKAVEKISTYISHENESALRLLAPIYLSIVDLLLVEGIIESSSTISLQFKDLSQIQVKPVKFEDKPNWVDLLSYHKLDKPLWLQHTNSGLWEVITQEQYWTDKEQYFWFTYMPQHQSLYIKLNYIAEHPQMSLASFMNKAMLEAKTKNAQKIILDLRHNTGGMGDSNRAIKLALQRWSGITEFGNVFFIVGRKTYSAAILLLADLEKEANVVFIGEEIGGKPQHIGDSKKFILPHSNLTLRVSVKQHYDWTGMPDRSSIWLHYPIPFTFEDYRTGQDAALEFALNYNKPPLSDEIIRLYKNSNINVAMLILYHLWTDPLTAQAEHAEIAYSLANYLFKTEQNTRYAQAISGISLEYNANHLATLMLKAEIELAENQTDDARELLEKVLSLDPTHALARKMLAGINGN